MHIQFVLKRKMGKWTFVWWSKSIHTNKHKRALHTICTWIVESWSPALRSSIDSWLRFKLRPPSAIFNTRQSALERAHARTHALTHLPTTVWGSHLKASTIKRKTLQLMSDFYFLLQQFPNPYKVSHNELYEKKIKNIFSFKERWSSIIFNFISTNKNEQEPILCIRFSHSNKKKFTCMKKINWVEN